MKHARLDSKKIHTRRNLVLRSLVYEAEGEIWSSREIQVFFFDLLDCERMTRLLSSARTMAFAKSSVLFK